MEKFSKTLAKVEDSFLILSAVMVVVIMILTVIDVSGRYLFRSPLIGSVELCELLLMVMIAVAIAGTQRVGGHVGMDVLINRLKRTNNPLSPAFQIFTLLVGEVVFLIAFFFTFKAFLASIDMYETTLGPVYMTVWPVKGMLSLGLLLMSIRLAEQLTQAIKSIFKRRVG